MKSLQRPLSRQKGLTGISIIILIGMIAFFAASALTLFPVYMENFDVSTHVQSLKDLEDVEDFFSGC